MSEKTSLEGRIFKLSTGEKIAPADLEKLIGEVCHYIKYVAVSEDEKENPVALIFPNKKLLDQPDYKLTPEEGCFCPRSLDELGRCLTGCLKLVNRQIADDSLKLKSAAIINNENYSADIVNKYKALLREKHGDKVPADEEIYFIKNV
ncbi:MAG: hypothetical protein HY840_00580 [Bacteroidetes bacterium]|nr:hypothetical protein [Bacteroidota bacterium]